MNVREIHVVIMNKMGEHIQLDENEVQLTRRLRSSRRLTGPLNRRIKIVG